MGDVAGHGHLLQQLHAGGRVGAAATEEEEEEKEVSHWTHTEKSILL